VVYEGLIDRIEEQGDAALVGEPHERGTFDGLPAALTLPLAEGEGD
jgi:hypothetical protein